jgi:hypothetical protein
MSDSIPSSANESFWKEILEEDITFLPDIDFFVPLPAEDVEDGFRTGVWPVRPPPVDGLMFVRNNVTLATVPEGSLWDCKPKDAFEIRFK